MTTADVSGNGRPDLVVACGTCCGSKPDPDGGHVAVWLGDGTSSAASLPDEVEALRRLFARDAAEIAARTPATLRNVAGYNLDRLHPDREQIAQLLVGSEGTLAFFSKLRLRLARVPSRRTPFRSLSWM